MPLSQGTMDQRRGAIVLVTTLSLLLLLGVVAAEESAVVAAETTTDVSIPQPFLSEKAKRTRRRFLNSDGKLTCRITTVYTLLADETKGKEAREFDEKHTACVPMDDAGQETEFVLPVNLPKKMEKEHEAAIATGTLKLSITGANVVDDNPEVPDEGKDNYSNSDRKRKTYIKLKNKAEFEILDDGRRRRLNNPTAQQIAANANGQKTAMVVRITANDARPPASLGEIESIVFGGGENSMASRYSHCSFNKLTFRKVNGHDIALNAQIGSFASASDVVDAAIEKLKSKTGTTDVAKLANHVLFCVPPGAGTRPWHAVSPVNHWRSQYNSEWCTSLGAQVHEMGHNLGLLHSGENTNPYGDTSGYMGAGSTQKDGPTKCFNGLKSYQLGWYSNRVETVNPLTTGPKKFALASFVDYQKTAWNQPVIINIDNTYFLLFNQKTGMNRDTGERGDTVTVTEATDSHSYNIGGLDTSNKLLRISNYQNTQKDLYIEVCGSVPAASSSVPSTMTVSISMGLSYCGKKIKSKHNCKWKNKKCKQHYQCCGTLLCIKKAGASRGRCTDSSNYSGLVPVDDNNDKDGGDDKDKKKEMRKDMKVAKRKRKKRKAKKRRKKKKAANHDEVLEPEPNVTRHY